MNLEDLKTNNKFRLYDKSLQKQLEVIRPNSLLYGRICHPIYVWEQTNEVVLGNCLVAMAKEHPELQYTIIMLPFSDWKEAQTFVIEYQIMQPYLSLWDKLVMTIDCEDYWQLKELAKRNQGTRNDIHTVTVGKLSSNDVNKIIADKIGCSTTTVSNFKAIYSSRKKDLIEKCKDGLSISSVYSMLKENVKKPKPETNPTPAKIEIVQGFDVFTECERNFDIGKKNINRVNGFVPDPAVCIQKMQKAKIPDGRIWLVFHKDLGVVQVMKKTIDKEKGKITVKVDSFNCQIKESADAMYIMEADHINSGPTIHNGRDESDFDNNSKGENDEI